MLGIDLSQRLWHGLWQDLGSFRASFSDLPTPTPGLQTFDVPLNGGQKRIHFRLEDDRSGVLFVDVTDVVHLNATAAEMAFFALCDVPQSQARSALNRRLHPQDRPQMHTELAQIYSMVQAFREPGQTTALFSHRANAPYKADLAITYGCNNACNHCYNEPDRFDMASLTVADWKRVIDTLHAQGVPHLIFTGGEATLNPDLPALIRYADGLGHVVGLNSNGRRMAHQPFMDELAASGLNHVQIRRCAASKTPSPAASIPSPIPP